MDKSTDLIIVGGSLNGCALALAAAGAGLSVTLIDAEDVATQSLSNFNGRSYAIALASQRFLNAIGLWNDLESDAQPMLEIKVTDGHVGEGPTPFFMHFDHAEIEEGPMGFMVEDRHLRRAFLNAVQNSEITHLPNARVVMQHTDAAGASVTLEDGTVHTGRVLIGCDGRTSGTAMRAGIMRNGRDYGQTAMVCAIAHEKLHGGIAHQFFMPAGPLAILPLSGNRSSIVWSETHETAAHVSKMSDDDFIEYLKPRFGDFLGNIELAGARYHYPLSLTLANALTSQRIALVGDAAHGVHPIAGQGLNAGLKDVASLVEVLALAKRRGEDIGSDLVLARYAQWRRFDVAALAASTDSFNALFSNDNGFLRGLRDVGMGIVNAVPALRRSFIREAAGLTGDLPKLMKGQSV